jgi:hypothetical protein
MTVEELCVGESKLLLPFAKAKFELEYCEKPDYSKLKFLLAQVLLIHDEAPNLRFDWSRFPKSKLNFKQEICEQNGTENVGELS